MKIREFSYTLERSGQPLDTTHVYNMLPQQVVLQFLTKVQMRAFHLNISAWTA